jgi:hypothetical protein
MPVFPFSCFYHSVRLSVSVSALTAHFLLKAPIKAQVGCPLWTSYLLKGVRGTLAYASGRLTPCRDDDGSVVSVYQVV